MQNTTYKSFYFFKLIFFTFLFSFTTQIRAQFPFIQSFKNSTAPGIEFGGSPKAFLTGGAGLRDGYNDIDGEGYLRLTNKSQQQRGIVWSDLYAFPSKYGMTISFEYYTYGGTGADGIAFILFDATASPVTAGAFGSSLGYAQQTGVDGFSKGYLGIGIDEYGGFASNDGGKTGGSSSGISSNITLRGQGSGTTGYSYLTGAQTTISPNSFNVAGRDRTATDDTKSGFRKIEIVLNPRSQGGFFIDVNLTHGNIKSSIITNYAYTTIAPQKLKFAISSSTGAETNFHEIRNLDISVDLPTLFEPIATPLSFSGCAGLPATSLNDINTNNNGSVNTLGSINRESIDLDLETPGIQASKTIEGKGTFSYDSVTGKITFKPTSNTVEGTITIDYTFKDNYGKPSNISNITYTAIVNRPADIVIPATICLGDSYLWSLNGQSYSNTGTYKIINDGCTANQELVLTVRSKPAKVTTTKEICSGESFLWDANNASYNTAGTYVKTNNGCTADQELILTVTSKPAKVTTTKEICSGDNFLWDVNNTSYNTAGTYVKTNNGCTADQELVLTVTPKPAKVTTTKEICSGESFLWDVNNTSYNTAGTYIKINNGCTADQELVLTITPKPEKVTTTKEICSGESFLWDVNNTSYNTAGTYVKTNNGCTADQELNLIVLATPAKPTFSTITQPTCRNVNGSFSIINYEPSYIYTVTPNTNVVQTGNIIMAPIGQYTVEVNNGNCQSVSEIVLINSPSALAATLSTNSLLPELCSGDKDGSFKIEISGGTTPYSVNLDATNGPYLPITGNEHMFINLSGGIHTVYVKDTSGCTTELKVMMPKAISINPVVNINYDCVNNFPSNSVTISIDKTITDYSDIDYALDGGIYQPDNIFTNIAAGTHTITARHSNGCTQLTTPFTIKDIQPLTLSLTDGDLNEIITTAAGGGSEYQYSIDGESYSRNNKFIIYKSGDYTVTITDKNGCTAATTRYFEYIDVCIPNYFTPNGDGINDEWGPGCTENYKSLTFTIFDRYGRIIGNFKYGQRWDGKYNGAELTSGDYWYTLKLNDPKDEREFVGHFTLYR